MKRVYFLRPVGHLTPIKIGCSLRPENRLETFATWSPLRLEVVATAPGAPSVKNLIKRHGASLPKAEIERRRIEAVRRANIARRLAASSPPYTIPVVLRGVGK